MKKICKIFNIIALIILIPVLIINIVILYNSFASPDEVPSFMGWKPFIVLSDSMEGEIEKGDLVIVKEVEEQEIKPGDIIAYRIDGIVITHRLVETIEINGEIKYITKGDNNAEKDSGYIVYEQIEGEYQFAISGLGNIAIFIQTPLGMVISLSIPIMLLLLMQLIENKRNKEYQIEKAKKEKQLEEEIEKLKKQNDELKKDTEEVSSK